MPTGEGWPLLETEAGLGVWQGRQLQKDLESVSRERDELQEGLRRSNEDCAKQVGPGLCRCPHRASGHLPPPRWP